MNTVERVARAICLASGREPNAKTRIRDGKFVGEWVDYIDHAVRAISAMREPSEAMVYEISPDGAQFIRDQWRTMIDAALAEGGGE